MRHKFSHGLLVVLLLASSALAQQRAAVETSPDVERLRAHVTYLASDKLDGRRTGTPGAELAARYIADEFKRLGLRAGVRQSIVFNRNIEGSFGSYLQAFPYVASVELGRGNTMTFFSRADGGATASGASLDLRVREDWMPLGWSANGRLEKLPVAFVGYGISAADLNHDDYAGVEVRDRVALALAGTPDGDNPHGQFVRHAELRMKAAAARDRGAKALVVVSGEEHFPEERLTRLRYDQGGDAGIPIVVISRQAARRIFEAAGVEPAFDRKPTDAAPHSVHTESAPGAGGTLPAQTPPAHRSASAPLPNVALGINVDLARRERPAHNVVGVLEGSDPSLKNESIVIGAHYDHLGRGGQGSLAGREGEIHHGADDNASGTAGLIELARLFAGERGKLRRTVVFIAFGGEEEGLLGSNFYVNHPAAPLAQTVAMINMDMIGRLKEDRLMIGGAGTAPEWKGWIERINSDIKVVAARGGGKVEETSVNIRNGEVPTVVGANGRVVATANPRGRFALALSEDGFGPSDHSSFYAKKIPVLFFFTGTHEDYHKPSDTAEKINYAGEARVLSFVREIVSELQASDRRPTYTVARSQGAGRSGATGFRVYLGTVPNYADSNDGMKLDAVRDDSPAAKAGLRAGDVIVKMAGREIRNVYDYTYALGEMKAGQEYDVEVRRDGKRVAMKLIPATRR